MRKLSFILAGVCLAIDLYSQVLLNPQLPQVGLTVKSQLWNLTLINTGNDEPDIQIEVLFTDVATNQPIFSGSSRIIRLSKGVRHLKVADLNPIVYNVSSNAYNVDLNPNGFLPIGNFSICYRITRIINDLTERLAEECEMVEIEPLSPPTLNRPFDEEPGEATRPAFSWLPPMPYHLFRNLAYDFTLVEVNSLQTSGDAIQQNVPVFRQTSLNRNSLNYPLSSPELDTSKLYAWQVTAKSSFNAIAKSEIWTFRVKTPTQNTNAVRRNGHFYAKLKPEMDASYVICKGTLHFQYLNESNDNLLKCTIIDLSSTTRTQVLLDSSNYHIVFGENYLDVDLSNTSNIKQGHIYLLEVRGINDRSWFLKFEYKNPN